MASLRGPWFALLLCSCQSYAPDPDAVESGGTPHATGAVEQQTTSASGTTSHPMPVAPIAGSGGTAPSVSATVIPARGGNAPTSKLTTLATGGTSALTSLQLSAGSAGFAGSSFGGSRAVGGSRSLPQGGTSPAATSSPAAAGATCAPTTFTFIYCRMSMTDPAPPCADQPCGNTLCIVSGHDPTAIGHCQSLDYCNALEGEILPSFQICLVP